MSALTQLVLVSLCVWAHGSSPGDGLSPRDGRRPAGQDDYEPYIYAAIPLHRPVPILQVLSRRPLAPERAPDEDGERAPATHNEYEYDERAPADHPYVSPHSRHPYPHSPQSPPSASASQDDLTVIYARPNPQGGFIYRRRPTKSVPRRSPPAPVSTTESPVVLRVHKYKIVRDR